MKKNDKVILCLILGVALIVAVTAVYSQIGKADFMQGDKDQDGFSNKYEVEHAMNPFEYDAIKVKSSVVKSLQDYTEEDLKRLNPDEYNPLRIEYDEEQTRVTYIRGVFSEVKVDSPLAAIYSIYNVKTLLGLTKPEEQLRYSSIYFQSNNDKSYTFSQYYKGIEVWNKTIQMSYNSNGKADFLLSTLVSEDTLKNVSLTPQIPEKDIDAIVYKEYNDVEILSKQLTIYIDDNSSVPELAYAVRLSNYYVAIISAYSGNVLSYYTDVIVCE